MTVHTESEVWVRMRGILLINRLTVRVGRFSSMIRRGAAESGDDGVVVGVGVVWVVHWWVVAVVFWGSSGDADIRFTDISRTRSFKLASVILLRCSAGAVVVIVALNAAYHWGISRHLGKSDLPLVADLGGLGVAQDFRALHGAVGRKACGSRAGDVIHLLAGRRGDVDGEFGTARHRLRGLGASSTHDGTGLGIVEVVVVGGCRGGSAQVTVIDAGGRHGVTVRGAGCPTGAGGQVR